MQSVGYLRNCCAKRLKSPKCSHDIANHLLSNIMCLELNVALLPDREGYFQCKRYKKVRLADFTPDAQ